MNPCPRSTGSNTRRDEELRRRQSVRTPLRIRCGAGGARGSYSRPRRLLGPPGPPPVSTPPAHRWGSPARRAPPATSEFGAHRFVRTPPFRVLQDRTHVHARCQRCVGDVEELKPPVRAPGASRSRGCLPTARGIDRLPVTRPECGGRVQGRRGPGLSNGGALAARRGARRLWRARRRADRIRRRADVRSRPSRNTDSSPIPRLCDKLLSQASPLLLYAQEIDPHTRRHLGNFPQAFSHPAMINAVMHLICEDERAGPDAMAWSGFAPALSSSLHEGRD